MCLVFLVYISYCFSIFRGIRLIERNEEVCVFYETLNIQGNCKRYIVGLAFSAGVSVIEEYKLLYILGFLCC